MRGHAFIQHFIQKEEPLLQRIIRHYAISASLHMRTSRNFQFRFSIRSSTRTLTRIRNEINHPLQSDKNVIPIELNRIDSGVYMKAFHSD